MTSTDRPRQVGLSGAADVDFDDILLWSEDRFDEEQIEVIRILHDSMDLARHLPSDEGET